MEQKIKIGDFGKSDFLNNDVFLEVIGISDDVIRYKTNYGHINWTFKWNFRLDKSYTRKMKITKLLNSEKV